MTRALSTNWFPAVFATAVFVAFDLGSMMMLAVPKPAADSADFEKLIQRTRWVDYAPTNYNPDVAPPLLPSEDSLRADMRVLRAAGFDGLVTYGAQLPAVVNLAREEGFRAVLLGVWNPASATELRLAEESAASPVVVGIIVGNEGLMFHRYGAATLHRAMEQMRWGAGKPVSTTETIEYFYTRQDLVDWSDFLTVNAHPYFHGHRDPERAVDWTLGAWDRLRRHVPNKPILLKEVGLPTTGEAENSESYQGQYYRRLLTTTDVQFAFFEAFDALFKQSAVERSWGIFRADRSPKPASESLLDEDSCAGPLRRVWCEK